MIERKGREFHSFLKSFLERVKRVAESSAGRKEEERKCCRTAGRGREIPRFTRIDELGRGLGWAGRREIMEEHITDVGKF